MMLKGALQERNLYKLELSITQLLSIIQNNKIELSLLDAMLIKELNFLDVHERPLWTQSKNFIVLLAYIIEISE